MPTATPLGPNLTAIVFTTVFVTVAITETVYDLSPPTDFVRFFDERDFASLHP